MVVIPLSTDRVAAKSRIKLVLISCRSKLFLMAPFQQIHLPLKKQLIPAQPLAGLVPAENGHVFLKYKNSPLLSKADQALNILWTKDFQLQSKDYVYPNISAHPGVQLFGITEADNFRLVTGEGSEVFRYDHDSWGAFLGSASIFIGQWVLFAVPSAGGDLLIQLDLTTLQTVSHVLEGDQEFHYTFTATPLPNVVFMACAAGQDDCLIHTIAVSPSGAVEIRESEHCRDRILGNFSPDGRSFVTAPHYSEGIRVHSFPDMVCIAELSQEKMFAGRNEYPSEEEEDTLEYTVYFLNNHTLVALTRYGRLLLVDRATMACFGELLLEGNRIIAYDQAGKPAASADEVLDYAGETGDVTLVEGGLVTTFSDGSLRLFTLPDIRLA